MSVRLLLVVLVALVVATPALASEENPTLAELEREVICPTCQTTLARSNAPIAERMRDFIQERIDVGDTKSEIKASLVEQFGEGVLAAPPKSGFNLAFAWVLPLVLVVGAAVVIGVLAWRWTRAGRREAPGPGDPAPNGSQELDPELERRLDEELARFDG